jgi:signal transduction histidine kinase
MTAMVPDQLRRLAGSGHTPVPGGAPLALQAVLGLAACAQATAQAVSLAGHQPARDVAVLYVVPLGVFALLATVPLGIPGPAVAAAAVTAGNTASLAAFGTATVAGIAAQLIAGCRLGARDEPRGPAGRPGAPGLALTQTLSVGLAVPFCTLALTSHGSVAAVLLAAGAPAAAAAGIAARARREARIRTVAGEALADTLTEHTARGERARIARELHDVVAHHISMIAVQAETARLTTPGLPGAGAQRLTEIAGTARAGLTEMRRLLGVLRDDAEDAGATAAVRRPQPGLPQLAGLIDATREASGAAARLIVSGPVAGFGPGVELAAYRIVQEALTNARRHAPGAAVDVELRYQDDSLHLRIRDNGPGPARPGPARPDPAGEPGCGHGLAGMRERAVAVGGSLRTGAAPGGGFLVTADLPAKPETA